MTGLLPSLLQYIILGDLRINKKFNRRSTQTNADKEVEDLGILNNAGS
jgi:hypothetical protein